VRRNSLSHTHTCIKIKKSVANEQKQTINLCKTMMQTPQKNLIKRAAEVATESATVLLKSNPKNNYLYKHNIYTIVSASASMYWLHGPYVLNIKNTHQPCHTDYNKQKTEKIATSKLSWSWIEKAEHFTQRRKRLEYDEVLKLATTTCLDCGESPKK